MPLPTLPFQQLTSQEWQLFQQQLSTTQMLQPYGSAIEMSFASMKDYFADRVRLSIKAKLPGSGFVPSDALSRIGVERQIYQNPGETDSSFATRLSNAWNVWPWAGSAQGVLRALYDAGYPNTAIVQQLGGLYTISVDANGNTTLSVVSSPRWDFDGGSPITTPTLWSSGSVRAAGSTVVPNPANGFYYVTSGGGTTGASQPIWATTVGQIVVDNNIIWQCKGRDSWSRFAVVFFSPFPASWGGTPPADGTQEQVRVSNLIRQWKSAHSTCARIVIATGGALWGYPAPMTAKTWGGGTAWRATWGTNTSPAPTYWTP